MTLNDSWYKLVLPSSLKTLICLHCMRSKQKSNAQNKRNP